MKNYLIIADSQATLFLPGGNKIFIESPDNIKQINITTLNLVLNTSDLDISYLEIPKMSFFDRQMFATQRLRHQPSNSFHGCSVFKDHLIDLNCAASPYIESWLKALTLQGIHVQRVFPFLLLPQTTQDPATYLVISDHGDQGIRQTAFRKLQPLFTRLTQPSDPILDEIYTTLTYLKNQHHFQTITIQAYVKERLVKTLESLENVDVRLQIYPLQAEKTTEQLFVQQNSFPYKFVKPKKLKLASKQRNKRIFNLGLSISTTGLAFLAIWQYLSLSNKFKLLEAEQQAYPKVEQQLTKLKANLPLEASLPTHYRHKLGAPSPLLLFKQIARTLPEGMIVTALKWERLSGEEKVHLDLNIRDQTLEISMAVNKIKEFANKLTIHLASYQVSILSLPHGSAEHETFAGATHNHHLTFSGEANIAKIQLLRKIR